MCAESNMCEHIWWWWWRILWEKCELLKSHHWLAAQTKHACTDDLSLQSWNKKTVHRKCSKSTDYAYAKMIQSNRISHKYIYIPAITLTLIFVLRTELNQNIHFILFLSIQNDLSKFHSGAQTQAHVHVRCHTHTPMKLKPICMHDTGHMCDFSLSMKRVSFVTRARACTCVYERVCLYTTAYYVM